MDRTSRKVVILYLAAFFLFWLSHTESCFAASTCLGKEPGVTIKAGEDAFLNIDYAFQLYGAWRDTGSGRDLTKSTTDFFFRRNRLTLAGQASPIVSFSLELEHSGDRKIEAVEVLQDPAASEITVLDANITANFSNGFKITAGKEKIPFTREIMEGCFTPLTVDRSLFIYTPMQRTRDQGVVFWGNTVSSKVTYWLGVQEGQDSTVAPQSSPRYTARAHFAFLDPEPTFGYGGTYLGNKMVLTIGGAAQFEPGAAFSDIAAKSGDKDYKAWTADLFFEYPIGTNGSITLSGAYLKVDFDEAYLGSNPDSSTIDIDGERDGWYAKVGYLILNNIGPGQVQPFVRYENWNYALLNGVYDQKIKWLGAGLNYLISGQALRVSVEYSKTDFEKEENLESQDFNTVITMLQFVF